MKMNALHRNKNLEAQPSRSSTSAKRASKGTAADRMRQRFTLVVAMFGFAVVTLDAQATNVALPAIHHDLGGGLSGLQWIVTGYTLMFSALLLFGGSLADRIGSRNGYRTGMLVFILASAACGLSPSLPFLIVARIVQGIGAALLTPTCLSLIREAFSEADERAKAIAYWALGGSVAAAAGPVLGGLLTQVNWRLIFFVNLPVGVAALIALNRVAPSTKRRVRFDWMGQLAAVVGLGGITFGVIRGGAIGFGSTQVELALVVGVLSLIFFVLNEAHTNHAMLPLALFKSRTISLTLGVAFITMACFYGVVFLQSLYFQELRGRSPIETGLLFLPMTGMVAATNPMVARIMRRFGRVLPIVAGQAGMAVGLIALAAIQPKTSIYVVSLLMILVGVGGAFTVPPVAAIVLDIAPDKLAGTASGVLNTFRQMGGSLGVAIFGALVNATGHFETGLRFSYVGGAILVGIGALAIAVLRPERARVGATLNRVGAH
jgi:MFS transporter, DHA2 family, methylenomycin A resistance protein